MYKNLKNIIIISIIIFIIIFLIVRNKNHKNEEFKNKYLENKLLKSLDEIKDDQKHYIDNINNINNIKNIKLKLDKQEKLFENFLEKNINVNNNKNQIETNKLSAPLFLTEETIIPKHIAIIMDGNRRYGEMKLGSKTAGHTRGVENLLNCIKWCQDLGVKILTVYAFSTENWKRDQNEIDFLMKLFENYSQKILEKALKNNIRVNILASEPELLPSHIRRLLYKMEKKTINNTSLSLNLCVSYGGRSEIIQATKKIVNDVINGNIKSLNDIDEELYERYLLTNKYMKQSNDNNRSINNNPDLLIRTSGELRLSNYLLYQLAYTEMIFLDKFWPEFSRNDLIQCMNVFTKRKRRYGK
jgi:undecaprenyl diphosphate synthase